jgi:hypothetical protein
LSGSSFSFEKQEINFFYPDYNGDFYVTGSVSFPPSAVPSINNIVIRDSKNSEIPAKIESLNKWPDNSVMSAQITFSVNRSYKDKYIIEYGGDIIRKNIFTTTAVMPNIQFSISGAPINSEKIDESLGTLNVAFDKNPDTYDYRYILAIVLLLSISFYRAIKVRKKQNEE